MLQPKKSPKEKKNTKDATQMKNMKPVFKGPNSKLPMPKNLSGKAKNGKPVKKAFLGSLLGGAGGGGGGKGMLGGMGKQMLGGMASKALGGLMGGEKSGKVSKAKSGTSLGMKSVKAGFDKNPGVTRADIITAATKKAQNGTFQPMGLGARKVSPNKSKYVSEDGNYKMKFKGGSDTSAPTSAVQRRTLKGFLKGAPKAAGKMALKSGGSMKKCRGGCK
jgi:hypothetical protein